MRSSVNADELKAKVIRLCRDGRKIEAIKLWREATGKGLAEAKNAVEALERGEHVAGPVITSGVEAFAPGARSHVPMAEIEELIRAERKIEAIKRYREATGLGLAEAKDAVDAIERAMDDDDMLTPAPRPPRASDGVREPLTPAFPLGLFSVLVLGFVVAGGALLYLLAR